MKKTTAFAIALTMALTLTLAACSGGNGGSPAPDVGANTPAPTQSPTPTPSPPDGGTNTPQPQDTPGGGEVSTPAPGDGGSTPVPSGRTVPNVSDSVNGLMESHSLDSEHFYAVTDDYLVYMRQTTDDRYGVVLQYKAVSFGHDNNTGGHGISLELNKLVFENNDAADAYYENTGKARNFPITDNVVYGRSSRDHYQNKEEFLDFVQRTPNVLDYYFSIPPP